MFYVRLEESRTSARIGRSLYRRRQRSPTSQRVPSEDLYIQSSLRLQAALRRGPSEKFHWQMSMARRLARFASTESAMVFIKSSVQHG